MNTVGGYNIEELQPGMSASVAKTVTEADIIMFAGVSTHINPAHLNEEYAKDLAAMRHRLLQRLVAMERPLARVWPY